jgi:hypothetical protein
MICQYLVAVAGIFGCCCCCWAGQGVWRWLHIWGKAMIQLVSRFSVILR